VKAELIAGTQSTGMLVACNEPSKIIDAQPNSIYLVRIQAEPSSSGMQYSIYAITIKVNP
jgi:hypothetical protein